MRNKILVGGLVTFVVLGGGVYFWARSVLAQDSVRAALAAQLSSALGQPVTVGSISAGIYPRVTVNLGEVSIGQPPRIQVKTLRLATGLGALLSRRIEHATVHLDGAKIELPLPALGAAADPRVPSDGADDGSPIVEIVSVDAITLNGVEILSGGRTLKGDIDAALSGQSLTLRKATLAADDTTLDVTGQLSDWSAPAGELTVKAGQLNLDRLLSFLSDFSAAAQPAATSAQPAPAASPSRMNLTVALEAESASSGQLTLGGLTGRARVTGEDVALDPVAFNIFGGRYEGALALTLGPTAPRFAFKATLSGIDVATAMEYAGQAGTMTGKMSGTIDLGGNGADLGAVMKQARGTARIDVTNGVVKGLGLVRSVIVATSMKGGATSNLTGSTDEPFTRLGGTLTISGGAASTQDFRFESENLGLDAAGGLRLDGSAVNLVGNVQLSETLTKQAGTDLVRYTQTGGRVTLPASITGSSQNLHVKIDAGEVAKRAITNLANEEVKKRLGGLGGLFGR
jgi:uncharacterized protein involved in outer membrane biogenesis